MTAIEIELACAILSQKFGQAEAAVAQIMLENGEMLVSDLHRRCAKTLPRAWTVGKSVEMILHKFYQNDLLVFNAYAELSEEEPFVDMNLTRVFYFLMEPLLCHAVEEIIGDDAAQVLSFISALASATAADVVQELHLSKGFSEEESRKTCLLLIQARAVVAYDPTKKPSDEASRIDSDAVARKQSWTNYVIKPNYPRLFVIYLLHLTRNRLETDAALSSSACEVFLGLCRAAVYSTPRIEFCCDESFQPVKAEDVLRYLPESVKDGYDIAAVSQSMSALVGHSDGFLDGSEDAGFVLKGAGLLGIWSEQFLYDILRTELPKVQLGKALMHYLIRSPEPYVQVKAVEAELFAGASQLKYAVNDLCRLGYVDLMGTSLVAQFEPGRTEHFLFVNLPRLYRQKVLPEQCKSLLRNYYSLKKYFKGMDGNLATGIINRNLPLQRMNTENVKAILDSHGKMEMGYLDCFAFSVIYIRASQTILEEQYSREANSLAEFFSRNKILGD